MNSFGHIQTGDLLPTYINGTLDPEQTRRVRDHLQTCAACRAELESWRAMQGAARAAAPRLAEPPQHLMARVWDEIEREEETVQPFSRPWASKLSLAWQLLGGQMPLVRKEIWAASAVTMFVGCLVALLAASPTAAGTVLAVFAPLIAAIGVAFIYGPENDPSLEVALATPTPPRLVLLARLTLVYGYDLALTLAATAVLSVVKAGVDPWPLISLWLGPMLFLSALTLLLSLLVGSTAAALVAMGFWVARLVAASGAGQGLWSAGMAHLVDAFWHANPILLPLAALLFALTLFYTPRLERLA